MTILRFNSKIPLCNKNEDSEDEYNQTSITYYDIAGNTVFHSSISFSVIDNREYLEQRESSNFTNKDIIVNGTFNIYNDRRSNDIWNELGEEQLAIPQERITSLYYLYPKRFIKNGKETIGLIAQEVEAVYPELVKTISINGIEKKYIDYWSLLNLMGKYLKDKIVSFIAPPNHVFVYGNSSSLAHYQRMFLNDIKTHSGSSQQSFIIKNDGSLWSSGYGLYGSGGLNHTLGNVDYRREVTNGSDWEKVFCSSNTTYAIKTDGSLWVSGYNKYGNFGIGDTIYRSTFTKVGTNQWKLVEADRSPGYFAFAIDVDNKLWATGYGTGGQLGFANSTGSKVFFTKVSEEEWKDVATSNSTAYYTLAIKSDGTLWGTGANNFYQIAAAGTTSRTTFTKIGNDEDWKSVKICINSSFAIKENGTMWGWGKNDNYLLNGSGTSTTITTPIQITNRTDWLKFVRDNSSISSIMAHTTDNKVWVWGSKTDYTRTALAPKQFITTQSSINTFQKTNLYLEPLEVCNHTDFVSVMGYSEHE